MARPVFFLEDFYKELAKEVDPEFDLTPESLSYLQDVAQCFVTNVLRHSCQMAGGGPEGRPGQITDREISYVLRNYYKMPLPANAMHLTTEPGQYFTDPVPQYTPVEGYQEKLDAVMAYRASQADD